MTSPATITSSLSPSRLLSLKPSCDHFLLTAFILASLPNQVSALSTLSVAVVSGGSAAFVAILVGFIVWKLRCDNKSQRDVESRHPRHHGRSVEEQSSRMPPFAAATGPAMVVRESGDLSNLPSNLESILEGQGKNVSRDADGAAEENTQGSLWSTFFNSDSGPDYSKQRAEMTSHEETIAGTRNDRETSAVNKRKEESQSTSQLEGQTEYCLAQPIRHEVLESPPKNDPGEGGVENDALKASSSEEPDAAKRRVSNTDSSSETYFELEKESDVQAKEAPENSDPKNLYFELEKEFGVQPVSEAPQNTDSKNLYFELEKESDVQPVNEAPQSTDSKNLYFELEKESDVEGSTEH